jgi:Cu+-exporting ATPase
VSRLRGATKPAGPRLVLAVEGMHCAGCGLLVDDILEDVPGVRSARTDVRAGRSVVDLDDAGVAPAALVAAVGQAGYRATLAT